ncbi:FAD-dependent monooxygenase [Mycobacterium deserti]|uniref:FAD-dependent monooxygenase n=1 Tax=Mycobacterium deserti TaxID=2978347 RepID=A0ABT2MEN6_9MYCO|nr:FAD-dependent monooxygenase [Mycobacterium deserti]MCT7660732.1 FAD-dependent monooxygenase [Mycobacterium deserti]
MASEPVVIVGAGPTGLMMALLLARQGIRSVLLERTTLEPRAPKAHVLNPRSLEIARAAELDVERMRASATSPEDDRWALFVTTMTGDEIGRSPYERQDDTHTPLPRINIAQPRLEQILIDAIRTKSCIELRIGHQWLSAEQSANGVVSRVRTDNGSTYLLRASYLLGADGAGSTVRKALGIELEGTEDVSRCLTIHFEANLRPLVVDRPAMFYWVIGAPIPGIFIAYDIDNTWVYLSFSAPEHLPTTEEVLDLLRSTIGKDDLDLKVRHVIPWNLAGRVATRYRSDRIFLVGDACHSFPPAGGLGMNTGIQDAHNLAWKLAAVIHGWADRDLLDTYEAERRPVALRNAEQSLKNAEGIPAVSALSDQSSPAEVQAAVDGMFDNFNSLAMQIGFTYGNGPQQSQVSVYQPSGRVGDRMPHAWIDTADRGRISSLDLLDDQRFTLLTRSPHYRWKLINPRIPMIHVCVSERWHVPHEWLETMMLTRNRGVLVRPDGHIESHLGPDDFEMSFQLTTSLSS